jgi:hypothetical protein
MTRKMIRYTVKPDRAGENEALLAKVFEELAVGQPQGLRYATFKLNDGVDFVHIVSYESEDDSNASSDLPAFKNISSWHPRWKCSLLGVSWEPS